MGNISLVDAIGDAPGIYKLSIVFQVIDRQMSLIEK